MESLDQVPWLLRREIEARILAPFCQDLSAVFGEEAVAQVLQGTIERLARQQGAALAQRLGGNTLEHLLQVVALWQEGEALQVEMEEPSAQRLCFRVTYCAYAEMYRQLGIPKWGRILSCQRDAAFIQGFNPNVDFRRTQTLLEGAPYCDFCYAVRASGQQEGGEHA